MYEAIYLLLTNLYSNLLILILLLIRKEGFYLMTNLKKKKNMFYWYMTSDACNYEKWLIVVFKFKNNKKKVN